MSRPARVLLDEKLRRQLENVGLVVLGEAVACDPLPRMSKSRAHVASERCWCGPILIQRETITEQEDWLHRTKAEAN